MWAAGRSCTLVWTAVTMLVMTGNMLDVAADCTCEPDNSLCLGNDLTAIMAGSGAATITFLNCFNGIQTQSLPTTIGLLTELTQL